MGELAAIADIHAFDDTSVEPRGLGGLDKRCVRCGAGMYSDERIAGAPRKLTMEAFRRLWRQRGLPDDESTIRHEYG